MRSALSHLAGSLYRGMAAYFVAVVMLLGLAVPAFADAPTLPDTGVDMSAWIPVLVTAFGGVLALIIGAYFAFLVLQKGLQRIKRWAFG